MTANDDRGRNAEGCIRIEDAHACHRPDSRSQPAGKQRADEPPDDADAPPVSQRRSSAEIVPLRAGSRSLFRCRRPGLCDVPSPGEHDCRAEHATPSSRSSGDDRLHGATHTLGLG